MHHAERLSGKKLYQQDSQLFRLAFLQLLVTGRQYRNRQYYVKILGVLSDESSWFVKTDDDNGISGAQIDLLIDRRDHVVSLCEIKYSISEYDIDKTYEANLRNKISTFSKVTNCKKTIQLVMITTFGVKRNKYSGLISTQVLLDDLFQE